MFKWFWTKSIGKKLGLIFFHETLQFPKTMLEGSLKYLHSNCFEVLPNEMKNFLAGIYLYKVNIGNTIAM